MGWWHHLFEPEETVGTAWHRAAERLGAETSYPDAAVRLETEKGRLAVLFRGLGGGGGVEVRALPATVSTHRLGFLRRVGNEAERVKSSTFDGVVLGLPEAIDSFPDASLNSDLYLWLAALTACAEPPPRAAVDPLQADLEALRHARLSAARTLDVCPGLERIYARLAASALDRRLTAKLPAAEQAVELAIRALLANAAGLPVSDAGPYYDAIASEADTSGLDRFEAPLHYKTYRPVPLWPAFSTPQPSKERSEARDDEQGGGSSEGEEKRLKAERRQGDQADRKDSLILHRFEHILSWAEFLNINRAVDDDEEDNARKIADDADKISVVKNRKKAATRLKFDLDLAPEDVDIEKLSGKCLYPEWDYRSGGYHADYCRVLASKADEATEQKPFDPQTRRRIAAVRRRFEALRPKRTIVPHQIDGEELDLEAAVRAAVDIRACGEGSDRIWRRALTDERDLAVSLLVDTSRSTEGTCGKRTVIEIAREAVVAITEGISACGDAIAVHSFSSLRRDRVYVRTIKDFDETVDEHVRARIAGMKPGFYTRIGPALRHTAKELAKRPNRKKLLIVLTDGKPNDLDHYQGRYGVEDTRRAVLEARRQGLAVFGVTVDAKARSYFPYIFGSNGFAIVSKPQKLGEALPVIWQHLVDA